MGPHLKGGWKMSEIREKAKAAKEAAAILAGISAVKKNEALLSIASRLLLDAPAILEANAADLAAGRDKGTADSVLDRIMLNEARLRGISSAINELSKLSDPVGGILENIERPDGLIIQKLRVPLGVIGMIYEARPNVTADAATLALKTGNAVLLRGSSSALHSNKAIVRSIHTALSAAGLPEAAVQLIEDTSRESVKELFHLKEYLDVLIPRGGRQLIETVVMEASVPVIETGAGNCHIFIDESAQPEMAERIVLNAKTQRPSVCNAAESLVIHRSWLETHGTAFLQSLYDRDIEIAGDSAVRAAFPSAVTAGEEDWGEEYLDLKLSVKTVTSLEEAVRHINRYGTGHSEAILTESQENAARFLRDVDAAAVYHNASTRFTDGYEFGYGAEIGISTQKLHARGPMGLEALTSTKYMIYGSGQIRE